MSIFDNVRKRLMGSEENEVEPIDDAHEQPDDEQKIVAWVRNKAEESRKSPARVSFESQVVTNTAYILGFDSVYFDSRSRMLRSYGGTSGTPQKSRVHENIILPTIQNRLARLCKNPPRYDVRPNSNSQEDKEAARLSLKVIQNVMEREKANEKRIELYMWRQQAGHSYIKVYWDPEKGRDFPSIDESGEVSGVEKEGDIALEVTSPLEIFVDPLAKTLDEAAWIIQAKVRKLSYFKTRYPERGGLVKEEGPWLQTTQNILKINNMSNKSSGAGGQDQMANAAIELAYYERPTKKHPYGRMIVVANGVLLEHKALPVGKFPFVKFDDVKVGGKYYPESIVTHMRPLQDQYNRNLRRKAEFLNKGLTLKFLAAKGHGLHEEALNDSTEVVEYNPVAGGSPPVAVTAPQMPSYVYTDSETLKAGLNTISGISEPSQGQAPSASIPAIGMQLLIESDETRIGIITESDENAWAEVGELITRFAARYYTNERYIKESGQNKDYVITSYSGKDLRESHDVVVIRGSTLPGSKVLKRQELLNVYTQGLLGDPADPIVREKVLNALEFGDVGDVWQDQAVDSQQIKKSIEEIERGLIPIIHPDDNHQAHFECKNRLRKTDKFASYPDEVKMIFLQDLEEHKQLMIQAQMPPMPPGMEPPMGPPPAGEEVPMDLGPIENVEDQGQMGV